MLGLSHFSSSGHTMDEVSAGPDDFELLRRYAEDGAEEAFAELVRTPR